MEPMTTPAPFWTPAASRLPAHYRGLDPGPLRQPQARKRATAHAIRADTVADLSQLGRLDTAGASLLAELLGSERLSRCTQDLPEASRALLKNVYCSVQDYCIRSRSPSGTSADAAGAHRPRRRHLWQDTMQLLGFSA
jgi:phospholipid/cholesterol/gamma-HCH transport system permease protein